MAIATIAEAIVRGDISIYLAANNNANGALFGKRLASPGSPRTIAMVTDALRWGYDGGAQTEISLRETTNFLIWLIGIYGQQSIAISGGSGGGSIIPTTGSPLPNPYDWVVGATTSSTSPLKDGDTTVTLDGTNGTQDYRGYNIDLIRGDYPQYTTPPPDGMSTYHSWNRVTGQLTLLAATTPFGAAQSTERFRIIPSR